MRSFIKFMFFFLSGFSIKAQPTQFSLGGAQQLYWNWRPDISDSSYEFILETYNTVHYSQLSTCSRVGIYYWNECTYTKPYFNCTSTGPGVITCVNSLLFDTLFKVTPGNGEFDSLCGYINPYNFGMSGIADTYNRTSPNRYKIRYKGIVTLPEKCSKWHFSIGDYSLFDCNGAGDIAFRTSNRRPIGAAPAFELSNIDSFTYIGWYDSIQAAVVNMGSFHMVTLNNLDFQNNSSPRCLNTPWYVSPIGQQSILSPAPYDPDHDSLNIQITDTLFSNALPNYFPSANWQFFVMQNSKGDYSNDLFMFKNWFAPLPGQTGTNPLRYDAKYNPFDTDSTFQLDTQTGQVSFVAKSEMHPLLFFSIKDYRNGILASETFYFNQFTTLPSTRPLPQLRIDTSTLVGGLFLSNGRIKAFKNIPLQFEYDILLNSANGVLSVKHTADSTLPGTAVCQIINNKTDSVRCKFSWTPGNTENGLYTYFTEAKDTNCVIPFAQHKQVFTHAIEVGSYPQAIENFNENHELTISPNPGTGIFNVHSNTRIEKIEIFDLSGKKMVEHFPLQQQSFNINLSSLPNGIYMISSPLHRTQKLVLIRE